MINKKRGRKMKFELFKQLYTEALEYDELDMYIAERGWQEWMDEYNPIDVLPKIYKLANSTLAENRERVGLNKKGLSNLMAIPYRSIQNWELGERTMPTYLKLLIDYALFTH